MPTDPQDPAQQQVSVPPEAVAPHGRPGASQLRPEHLYRTAGLLFLLALVYRYFAELTRTFLLLYASALLAVVLNAVVARVPFRRKWVAAAIGVLIVGGIGSLVGFGVPVLVTQLRSLSAQAPRFEATLQGWEGWIRANTGLNVHMVGPEAQRFLQETFLSTGGGSLLGRAQGIFEVLLIPLLVLFGALFAVGKPNERLLSPTLRAVPRHLRPAVRRIFELLGVRIIGWMKGTLIGMGCVGGLSYLFFSLIGIPNALLLAVLAGLLEFVPLLGPWIAAAIAVVVAFLADPSRALWAAVASLAVQQIENHLIVPWAMSRAAELHPFVTIFAIVLFGSLFGFMGVFLAVPLALLFWTVIEVLWVEHTLDTDEDRIRPVVQE